MSTRERQVVSVLFTDIVASTERAVELGDAGWRSLLARHDQLVRDTVAAHGGRVVKTVGDGAMSAFGRPAEALQCGRVLCAAVRELELEVRAGVHTGECELVGDDLVGVAVHTGARIAALAAPGEVLVSGTVRDLVAGSDLWFVDRGTHVLRGVPGTWGVFSLGATDGVREAGGVDPSVRVPIPARLAAIAGVRFVGRERERAALDRAIQAARAGEAATVLLAGEPGIGKTRLAAAAAVAAHAAGATALYGRCEEDLGLPMQPFVEAIDELIAHADTGLLRRHVGEHGGELSRVVPRLERRVPGLPAPRAAGDDDRYLLFAAIAGLLADTAADAPVVLVLDDVHWADRTSILLLRHLIASRATPGVAVIATYRSTELDPDAPLGRLLADLPRETHVERLELEGLREGEILALMEEAAGHALDERGPKLARALCDETGGNPFFVRELLRSLVESGDIYQSEEGWQTRGELTTDTLPRSVRDVILRRVRRLGEDAFTVLSAAAVIGRDIEVDVLGQVLGVADEDGLLDILEDAVQANLLVEVPADDIRFSFAHALIEYALYDELTSSRRRRLHRRVGEALEALYGDDTSARVGELAFHWAEAAHGTTSKAQAYAQMAGDRAIAQLAFDEAVGWYREALRLAGTQTGVDDNEHCDLLFRLGDAMRRAGNDGYGEILRQAAQQAREIGDTGVLVRAALANARGVSTVLGDVDVEQVAVLEAALEAVGGADSPERAQLLAMLALELMFDADSAPRRAIGDEALAVARRLGDRHTLLRVLNDRFMAAYRPETGAERLADVEEAVAAIEDENAFESFVAVRWRTNARLVLGDIDGARADTERARRLAEKIREPLRVWMAQFPRMQLAFVAGELAEYERLANEMLELGTRAGQTDALTFYVGAVVALRREQGRMAEVQPLYAQAVAENPRMPAWRAGLAVADIEAGLVDEARTLVGQAAAMEFSDLPRDFWWMVGMAQWASAAVALGDREACASLYEQLAPFRGQLIDQGSAIWGTVTHFLSLLSVALERYEDAERDLDEARVLHERIGAPIWVAGTGVQRARMLLARDGAAADGEARELLVEGLRVARDRGAGAIERDAAAMLEQLGMGVA